MQALGGGRVGLDDPHLLWKECCQSTLKPVDYPGNLK